MSKRILGKIITIPIFALYMFVGCSISVFECLFEECELLVPAILIGIFAAVFLPSTLIIVVISFIILILCFIAAAVARSPFFAMIAGSIYIMWLCMLIEHRSTIWAGIKTLFS